MANKLNTFFIINGPSSKYVCILIGKYVLKYTQFKYFFMAEIALTGNDNKQGRI